MSQPYSEIPDNLFSPKAAARFLGVTDHTLAVWRCTKRYALPYVKVGRLVKYRREDLERFIQQNRCSDGGVDA